MDLLSYSVVSGDIYGYFKIDMKDGKLYVRKVLNFESPENKFKIVVDVTDLGGLKDSALCTIDIRDVNEAPQFDLDASFVRYIIEDDYSGAFNSYREVDGGVVQAFDPDYGMRARAFLSASVFFSGIGEESSVRSSCVSPFFVVVKKRPSPPPASWP